jgi:acetoin utilization protein AcuB
MTFKPAIIHLQDTLRDALAMMERIKCHHLPVLSGEGHLIGIISDRDCRTALNSPYILRETWQDDELARRLQVRTIMTPAPIVVAPESPAEEAARLMLQNRISCLPVMRDETLVGIITTSDILKAFIHQFSDNGYHSGDKLRS